MFNRILGKLLGEKNKVQRQIVKEKTEPNKYLDEECNLYRYSIFIHHSDKNDDLYEFIEGFHTIPVKEVASFEEAASKSISFKENYETFNKKLLLHQSLKDPQEAPEVLHINLNLRMESLYNI